MGKIFTWDVVEKCHEHSQVLICHCHSFLKIFLIYDGYKIRLIEVFFTLLISLFMSSFPASDRVLCNKTVC